MYGVSHNIINLARSSFWIRAQAQAHTNIHTVWYVFVPVYLSILFLAVIAHGKYKFSLSVAIYACVLVNFWRFVFISFWFLIVCLCVFHFCLTLFILPPACHLFIHLLSHFGMLSKNCIDTTTFFSLLFRWCSSLCVCVHI